MKYRTYRMFLDLFIATSIIVLVFPLILISSISYPIYGIGVNDWMYRILGGLVHKSFELGEKSKIK